MAKNERITTEIEGTIKAETELAVLIDTGDQSEWIPKSKIYDQTKDTKTGLVTIEIPEWLAISKGLA